MNATIFNNVQDLVFYFEQNSATNQLTKTGAERARNLFPDEIASIINFKATANVGNIHPVYPRHFNIKGQRHQF